MIKNTKNIERAIQQEVIYVVRKAKGEDVKIDDFINSCGYSSANEFYWDKQIYLLKQSNCVELEEPYIDLKLAKEFLENKIPAFLWTINCPTTYAFVPNEYVDTEPLIKHGLEPVKIGYPSSVLKDVIISSDGDLRIFLIYPGSLDLRTDHIVSFFKDYLDEYFENVTANSNSVFIKNKKVLGSIILPSSKMGIFVAQVSFSDKSELVKKVCTGTTDAPGFIDPTVLSPYALKDGFSSWLEIQH